MMRPIACPGCGTEMKPFAYPDITVDECPSCRGVFLEKGELNTLATGMAGDIEYCSIGFSRFTSDRFSVRSCPLCDGRKMKKINLLAFTHLIFDYCEECGSFFLDRGEIPAMNQELREMTPDGVEQEYRECRGQHLVRIDRRTGAVIGGLFGNAFGGVSIQIVVYFAQPLGMDLRVFQERWYARLAAAFHMFRGEEVETGDAEFDCLFRVQGIDPVDVSNVMTPEFRQAAVSFVKAKPQIILKTGFLKISRLGVSYYEGPYEDKDLPDVVERAEGIVASLIHMAELLEPEQAEKQIDPEPV